MIRQARAGDTVMAKRIEMPCRTQILLRWWLVGGEGVKTTENKYVGPVGSSSHFVTTWSGTIYSFYVLRTVQYEIRQDLLNFSLPLYGGVLKKFYVNCTMYIVVNSLLEESSHTGPKP
jgi:hypothetical protein